MLRFLDRLRLFTRTVQGLRPIQWVFLPLRYAQARLGGGPRPPREWPTPKPCFRADALGSDAPEEVIGRADRVLAGQFRLLGHTEILPDPAWERRYVSHLWNYHLHYFDYGLDLVRAYHQTRDSRYLDAFSRLALSWTKGTKPGHGDGWQPYPLSVRLVNWIQALALAGADLEPAGLHELTRSLALQARWLERRLELHIQGNHLQKNYTALAWAGLFFRGRAASRWRRKGLEGAWRSLREQVLADGSHYERSPMYHALALVDFLELIAACTSAGVRVPDDVRSRVVTMLSAFSVLCRPDGQLHLFNDAAQGSAPSRCRIEALASEVLGERMPLIEGQLELPDAGYYGFAADNGDRLLIDCGVPGPRYQPGHAHCDLLSFELDLNGEPVVVDSGVHGYGGDPFRDYARSTRAHNTIMIGDREQSELWSTFRVGRMAEVGPVEAGLDGRGYRFRGTYSPYFDARTRHQREIRYSPGQLVVTDRVQTGRAGTVRSYLHFHPRMELREQNGQSLLLTGGGVRVRVLWTGVERVRVGRGSGDPEGWFLPEFGRAEAAPVVVGECEASEQPLGFEIRWI